MALPAGVVKKPTSNSLLRPKNVTQCATGLLTAREQQSARIVARSYDVRWNKKISRRVGIVIANAERIIATTM